MKFESRYFATIAPALTAICLLWINLRMPGKNVQEQPPFFALVICGVFIAGALLLSFFYTKKSR